MMRVPGVPGKGEEKTSADDWKPENSEFHGFALHDVLRISFCTALAAFSGGILVGVCLCRKDIKP
jgi:hypothetical protein